MMEDTPQRIAKQRASFGDEVLTRHFGQRYVEYRRQWRMAGRREMITEFPLYIQLELSPFCNLACPSCIHGYRDLKTGYTSIKGPLSDALFDKIIEEAAKHRCPSMAFHNNNEPLLIKDLEAKIKTARDAGVIDLILTTNGTLLSKDRAEGLLESGLTKITFSLDAFKEETYKINRKNAVFSEVKENILRFLELKKKKGLDLPITRVSFVINKNNYNEAVEFDEYWSKRVDMVEFQNFTVIEGVTESLCPPGFEPIERFDCNYPWQQVVVRANGDILPCCSFYGAEIVLGNLSKDSIYDVWHGSAMNALREDILAGKYSLPSCHTCAHTFYTKRS